MSDATQEGAQTEIVAPVNPRTAAIEQMAQQVFETVHKPDLKPFDEDSGQVLDEDEQKAKEAEETEIKDEQPRDEQGRFASKEIEEVTEEPPKERMLKVKVYGEEKEIPESEVVKSFQIEEAARRNLDAAKVLKKQLEEALSRINQAPKPEGENPLQQPAPQTSVDPAAISAMVRQEVAQNEAVAKFKASFEDIAKDPFLWKMAVDLEDKRLWEVQNGIAQDEPLEAAFARHGNTIRTWMRRLAPSSAPSDKQERKASVKPVVAASVRSAAPVPEKPKTTADIVEEFRKARGFV